MQLAFVSSEIIPYASTGGLGDVAAALPQAVSDERVSVWRAMPLYRQVRQGDVTLKDTGVAFDIPVGRETKRAEVMLAEDGSVSTYFIRADEYFDRPTLYGLPTRDFADNLERFSFFQKAVVALLDSLGGRVDVVHCNDWQTGLLPLYLKYGINGKGRAAKERTVLTIHNLAYQGVFSEDEYHVTNLPDELFAPERLEHHGQVNCLKGGLSAADAVTTVSETYAREITTEKLGCGLQHMLRALGDRLEGIVNGVDYASWDPAVDPHIARPYSAHDLSGKKECKAALLAEMNLPVAPARPLLGMVARLADQKGLDLMAEAMSDIMQRDVSFVLLGSGDEKYEELCRTWASTWPEQFNAVLGFDVGLSHRIEAGADIFLMPSRYEPCGLNQMYSLRYGTLPVVHATGGLEDTIVDIDDEVSGGTGFKFRTYTAEYLLQAIDRSLDAYVKPERWLQAMRRAMGQDFSWARSARRYVDLYRRITAT